MTMETKRRLKIGFATYIPLLALLTLPVMTYRMTVGAQAAPPKAVAAKKADIKAFGKLDAVKALAVLPVVAGKAPQTPPEAAGAPKGTAPTAPATQEAPGAPKASQVPPATSQPAVAPLKGPDDVVGAGNVVVKATRSSNWRLAVIGGLLLVVIFLRKFGAKFWPWCASDRGGAILSLVAGLLTVGINSLVTGKGFDPQLLIDGFMTGSATAGVYSVSKKIGWPSDLPATKAGPEAPAATPPPKLPDEVPVVKAGG